MVLDVERTIQVVTGRIVNPPEPQNLSGGERAPAKKALIMLDHP
jgi:hypothetical protein